MVYAVVKYVVFLMCFGLSFYGISAIRFEVFCSVKQPQKVTVLMFVLSFVLAYIAAQAVLDLTILNGFGG